MSEELNQQANQQGDQQGQDQSESHSAQGQAGNPQSLKEMLPPDLQAEKEFDNYKDVASLAKAHLETKRYASKLRNERAVIPGEKSTPEEIAAFRKAIGVPENPEGYELPIPEFPQGMEFDAERTKKYSQLAHSKGIPKEAFQSIYNEFINDQKASYEAQVKSINDLREKTTSELKKEWTGNKFDSNLQKADQAGNKVFGTDFMKILKDTGLSNDATVIRGLYKLSQFIGEHDFVSGGETNHQRSTVTFEKLISMKQDPRYWDPSRRDQAYIQEVEAANKSYAEGAH